MIITTIRRDIERWKAEGEARGEAEGAIKAILDLVAEGDLPAERARTRLTHLHSQRLINDQQLQAALTILDQPR